MKITAERASRDYKIIDSFVDAILIGIVLIAAL